MAKPVVATPAAMEGIPGAEGLEVAIADEPSEFAGHVLAFLKNQAGQANVNRSYVQSEFSWQQNGHKLCQLLADMAES